MLRSRILLTALLCLFALPLVAAEPVLDPIPVAAQSTVPADLDEQLFPSEITQTGSMCTVTVQCSLTSISCSSNNGNCTTAQGGQCVKCDGVVQECCDCADCYAQCDINYYNCISGCDPFIPVTCNICERAYDWCTSACNC